MEPQKQSPHKGWYSRGYLPHFDQPGLLQGVTFHLADSLPSLVLQRIKDSCARQPNPDQELRRRIQDYLDAGHGACSLRDPRIAEMVEQALLYFDADRYRVLAWVVMPNHVHVVIETFPDYSLPNVVKSWKSYTAKEANKLLGKSGKFWHRDYFDRFIRDEKHFETAMNYVHYNPVKAGLVERAELYRFSSARLGTERIKHVRF